LSLRLTFINLLKHATTGITDGAVEKIRLPSVLHLQDEPISLIGLTINIIDDASLILGGGQFFLVLKNDILYFQFPYQQVIKKAYQQVFAELLSEESFESPISKRIDVFSHSDEFFDVYCKDIDFL
jgi:hypothetical protein